MLVKSQESLLCLAENLIVIAKLFWKISWPLKMELFHPVMSPPDAPMEGRNSKESKLGGLNFLRNCKSKASLLVSWKQKTSHPASVHVCFCLHA